MVVSSFRPKRIFLSHATADKADVLLIAERLKREQVWLDMWSMEAGEVLPASVASAVLDSSDFVIFVSHNSVGSRWVQYELNLAITRWLEQENSRIVVVRLDDASVPDQLRAFLYFDAQKGIEQCLEDLVGVLARTDPGASVMRFRRGRIVNRFKEVAAIERLLHEAVPFVFLHGLYGIGKTTIVKRAADEIFHLPLARFQLTEGHGPLRLALELAARSGGVPPKRNASKEELTEIAGDGLINLVEQGNVVFFDDVETVLEEDGSLRTEFSALLRYIHASVQFDIPVLFASTQRPVFRHASLAEACHVIRVGPLSDEDLLYCLENWLELTTPSKPLPPRDELSQVARALYGYPLAARLAANYVANYSVATLLDDLRHFRDLRIDIAKQLIGRLRHKMSVLEEQCLQALSLAEDGLEMSDFVKSLAASPDDIRAAVDNLSSMLLVQFDGVALQLHPIVRDYFWRRLYESGEWQELAVKLGGAAKAKLLDLEVETPEFVRHCARAYRLLCLGGKRDEATQLVYDLREELREVGKRLYRARQTALALEYLQLWLDASPDDNDSRYFVARCLTRLARYSDAEAELRRLEEEGIRRYRIDHAWGLLRRDQGRLEEAAEMFQNGLVDRVNYVPLLRDLGDVLDRLGDKIGALDALSRAYDLAPRDSYVVPKYVDVLVGIGRVADAVEVMEAALVALPDEGHLLHRMATILADSGMAPEALEWARRAAGMTSSPEVQLHLASLEMRYGDKDKAEQILQSIPEQGLTRKSRLVRDTVEGERQLRNGKLQEARAAMSGWEATEDSFVAHLLVRIELADAARALTAGLNKRAAGRAKKASDILGTAIIKFVDNESLLDLRERVEAMLDTTA